MKNLTFLAIITIIIVMGCKKADNSAGNPNNNSNNNLAVTISTAGGTGNATLDIIYPSYTASEAIQLGASVTVNLPNKLSGQTGVFTVKDFPSSLCAKPSQALTLTNTQASNNLNWTFIPASSNLTAIVKITSHGTFTIDRLQLGVFFTGLPDAIYRDVTLGPNTVDVSDIPGIKGQNVSFILYINSGDCINVKPNRTQVIQGFQGQGQEEVDFDLYDCL